LGIAVRSGHVLALDVHRPQRQVATFPHVSIPPRDLISHLLIITFDVAATFSMYRDAIALANIAAIATLDYKQNMEYLYRW
jgi:hypothetical protein